MIQIRVRRLTIVCPFTEEVSEPVRRLRAVRQRIIRFFLDYEDVPYVLGLLVLTPLFVILWLFFGRALHPGSWALHKSLDTLAPFHLFLAAEPCSLLGSS